MLLVRPVPCTHVGRGSSMDRTRMKQKENPDSPGKRPCCYQRVEKMDTRKKKGIFQKHKNNGISGVETINSYMYTKI